MSSTFVARWFTPWLSQHYYRNNPAEAAIYDWFASGTGNNGDGEGDGLAWE